MGACMSSVPVEKPVEPVNGETKVAVLKALVVIPVSVIGGTVGMVARVAALTICGGSIAFFITVGTTIGIITLQWWAVAQLWDEMSQVGNSRQYGLFRGILTDIGENLRYALRCSTVLVADIMWEYHSSFGWMPKNPLHAGLEWLGLLRK